MYVILQLFVAPWQISSAIGVSNGEGKGWNERFKDARQ